MNKAQLIEQMASKSGLSKVDAKNALEAFVSVTTENLAKGNRLALIGFGSFTIFNRKGRTGRNPQNGQEIVIPAKKVVKFKPGSDLASQL